MPWASYDGLILTHTARVYAFVKGWESKLYTVSVLATKMGRAEHTNPWNENSKHGHSTSYKRGVRTRASTRVRTQDKRARR